jgi:hypothetical protein
MHEAIIETLAPMISDAIDGRKIGAALIVFSLDEPAGSDTVCTVFPPRTKHSDLFSLFTEIRARFAGQAQRRGGRA